jgi:type 1 glutamine amidotransferase
MRTFRTVSMLAVAAGFAVSLGAQQPQPAAPAGAAAPAAGAQGGGRRGGGGGAQAANPNAVRVFIWAGTKTHPLGLHDYPQLLADWSKNQGEGLMMRGAVVSGALRPPSAADLENVDVIVMYKGDAEITMTPQQKTDLEAFIKRGGGFVAFHDSICVADTEWWANTVAGGAKRHGESNFSAGLLKTKIVDPAHPIMAGMKDYETNDEAFMKMTWAKSGVHNLATAVLPGGPQKDEVHVQTWTYEHTLPGGQPARAFVWMQGHDYKNFSDPTIYAMLQRGIAWAAKKPLDSLATVRAEQRGRGPGGSEIEVPGQGGAGRGGRGGARGQ